MTSTQHFSVRFIWLRLAPLFACTACLGLLTVMLGPLLPALILHWHIQDAQAGTLFTAFFLGQLLGAWFATRNLRFSLLGGTLLGAIGTGTMAWTGYATAHLALFVAGIGISAGLTAGNVIAGTATEHPARALALFNASWGIGAIACPVLVWLCGASRPRIFFLAAAALTLGGGIYSNTLPRTLTNNASPVPKTSAQSKLPLSASVLLFFGASMLIYIGNENSLGGWLPSFALRNGSVITASAVSLLYWASELAGRLLLAGLRVKESTLYRASLSLLLVTLTALLITRHPSPGHVLLCIVVAGISMGPLYPLIVTFLLKRTGNHPRLGHIFASCSLGGAMLPLLTGILSTHFGSLRAGLFVPLAGVLLMLLFSSHILPLCPTEQEG
ncbi:MFS transporter [Edaphobacter albus]|uniref:MFS transporter n=1 Tax=Edaphobacter sp. 4G125 TaxID=2763071 RepID=UPI001643FDA5|nr:MFS transporter [Edaphobacter sp. 4G125]QNI36065.1 MFS transporter [Edaphobacter sp. 4G125]